MTINIALIAVIIIIFWAAVNGYRRGLLGILFGLLSWVFIFIFILWTSPAIATALRTTSLDETIQDKAQTYINQHLPSDDSSIDDEKAQSGTNTAGTVLAGIESKIPDFLQSSLGTAVEAARQKTEEIESTKAAEVEAQVTETAAEKITDQAIRGIAHFIAFLLALLICAVIRNIIHLVDQTPVIHGINRFIGTGIGVFNGLFIVWILMYLAACLSVLPFCQKALQQIQQNWVLTWLFEHNLFQMILEKF